MNGKPPGILSLTYHLAFDDYYRQLWMSSDYATCFNDFGITDPAEQQKILAVNTRLGTANAGLRNSLIDEWVGLINEEIKTGSVNPLLLW